MNTMTEQDWEEIDRSSRHLVQCLLSAMGVDGIGEMHGNCCVDLSCVAKGKKVCLEIKDRSFAHDKYGDILVEDLKQERTQLRINNAQFDIALAVNVYTDDVVAIANLFDKEARHFKRHAPVTTLVKGDDHTYVQKEFCSLPQRKKYKFFRTELGIKFKRI